MVAQFKPPKPHLHLVPDIPSDPAFARPGTSTLDTLSPTDLATIESLSGGQLAATGAAVAATAVGLATMKPPGNDLNAPPQPWQPPYAPPRSGIPDRLKNKGHQRIQYVVTGVYHNRSFNGKDWDTWETPVQHIVWGPIISAGYYYIPGTSMISHAGVIHRENGSRDAAIAVTGLSASDPGINPDNLSFGVTNIEPLFGEPDFPPFRYNPNSSPVSPPIPSLDSPPLKLPIAPPLKIPVAPPNSSPEFLPDPPPIPLNVPPAYPPNSPPVSPPVAPPEIPLAPEFPPFVPPSLPPIAPPGTIPPSKPSFPPIAPGDDIGIEAGLPSTPSNPPAKPPGNDNDKRPRPTTAPATEGDKCKCKDLDEDEQPVIARPRRIGVPIVKQVGIPPLAKAVQIIKIVTIMSIKGVDNKSEVMESYRQKAEIRKTQIAELNRIALTQGQLTTTQSQVTANNVMLGTVNAVAVATQTAVNVLTTVANTTLTAVNAIANNSFVQKAVLVMNLVLAVHNAMMLSRNVAETVVDTVQLVARSLGFKLTKVDEDGNEDEVKLWDAVSGTVSSIVQSIIGAQNLATIQVKLGALNRIYHAASSVIDSTMDYFNTTWRLAEITIGNIGKVGNALRNSGQVFEDAYGTMEETFWGNRQQRFGRLTKVLEDIEEGADIAASVASTKISVGQAKEEIQEELNSLDEMLANNKQATDTAIQQKVKDSRIETDLSDIRIGNL